MNKVFLADFAYPCVAYAIRRLGIDLSIECVMSLQGEKYTPATVLEVGDVVIWERADKEISDATLTIGEHGPVTTKIVLGRHFGVYEGYGLVSDTTFDGDTYFPRIRLMPLSERSSPQKLLRLGTLREVARQAMEEKQCPKN